MPDTDPPLSVARRVNDVCDAFERAWRAGNRPSVDEYVAVAPESDRGALRSELSALEAELSSGRGRGGGAPAGSARGPALTVERPADQPSELNRIGRFVVRGEIGAGAFGCVYRAFDPDLDREVALKVPLRAALSDPADRERFLKEARAAATVSHPNVCPIHEVGEHAGRPYIVMPLVPGQTLAEVLRGRAEPLPNKQIAVIVRKLALALAAAHEKGVVHRDLKPANVMYDQVRKDLVVMDFGLARRSASAAARDTQSGQVMGTPAYMSPELARGDAKNVGPASDVFSLGVIMFELLTRKRPFDGPVHEVLLKIALENPDPPSSVRPGVDSRLEAICLKALAKDPRERYASMKEFAAAVDGYLRGPTGEGPSDSAGTPSADEPVPKRTSWWRRNSIARAAVVAVLGLLLVGSLLAWKPWRHPESGPPDKPAQPPLAVQWSGFAQGLRGGQWSDLQFKDGMTLLSREQYRLVICPSEDCYLYAIGTDGREPTLLFPHDQIQLSNRCRGKTDHQLPDGDNWYTLDEQTGTETVYIVASRERLPELEEAVRTKAVGRLEGLVRELERRSSEQLQTRGQTVEPDRRVAKATLKDGKEVQRVMEVSLGGDCVVKRIRFEHKSPSDK